MAREGTGSLAGAKGSAPRILIVDDEPTLVRAITELLEDFDFASATSLAGAREVLETEAPFDVVLLDKNLPDGSGIDFIKELHQRDAAMQIVVVTAYATLESAIDAVALGISEYLRKPFEIGELEAAVTSALQRSRQLRREDRERAALTESELQYRLLFECSPDPIFLVEGEDLHIHRANKSAMTCYGYTESEFTKRSVKDLVHPSPPEMDFDPQSWVPGVQWHQRSDGSAFPVEARSEICSKEGGQFVVHSFRDLSVRYRAEEQRQRTARNELQSQKLETLGLLAGGITHDINNLLTVLQGHAAFLREFLESNQRLQDINEASYDLDQISQAIRGATHVTQQLLVLGSKGRPHARIVQLNDVVEGLEDMLRRFLDDSIELILELGHNLPPVQLDRSHLEQAILSLVLNAREAIEGSGRITLSTIVDREGQVALAVRDSGRGMSHDTIPKIFDPFFTTKEVSQGTGLGLPMVKRIVDEFGGGIKVESSPGKGTSVYLSIPPCADAPALGNGPRSIAGRGEKVALVEDHPQVSAAIARILRKANYEVIPLSSGNDALALADSDPTVDLWVLDMVLPDLEGRDLHAGLRQRNADLRAVWITGYPEQEARDKTGLGDDDIVLSKPLDETRFLTSLRAVLERA